MKRRKIAIDDSEPDWLPLPEIEMVYENENESSNDSEGFEIVEREEEDDDVSMDEESEESEEEELHPIGSGVGLVLPRRRYTGHCNVETVKDGQFSACLDLKSLILTLH